jgi:hypothetical protein
VSGSSDKTIRVWKVTTHDTQNFTKGNDVKNVENIDSDVDIVDHCVFENEDGIRKVLFLENHPHLILAGDLVTFLFCVWQTLSARVTRLGNFSQIGPILQFHYDFFEKMK